MVGENTFERSRALQTIVTAFDGEAQTIDAASLTLRDIPDLFMATSLLEDRRLIVIKDLSENSDLWNRLPEWLDKVSDTTEIVLLETKPDRRTKTFKELKGQSNFSEFPLWQERDTAVAAVWLISQADGMGLHLDKKSAHEILERVGLDQYRLVFALEKLSLAEQPISTKIIEELVDADVSANVFSLFETALSGNAPRLQELLDNLKLTEDPYRVFGLLISQVFSLAAVYLAGEGDDPSRDLAVHPYVVKKLGAHAKKLSRSKLQKIVRAFFDADRAMKTTSIDPWLRIERVLAILANEIAS